MTRSRPTVSGPVVAALADVAGERGLGLGACRRRDQVGEHEVTDPGVGGEGTERDRVGVVVEDVLERAAARRVAQRRRPAGLVDEDVGVAGEVGTSSQTRVSPEMTTTPSGVVTR